jgi:DNA mismatch repair protein MutL
VNKQNTRSKIKQLDQQTINKIAAGEVVERPASVVKELIENSIDAQAKTIQVKIKGYGLEEIRIVDDGEGMSSEDAKIAWKSHTTSKIVTAEDLLTVTTMGFRGEAIASIAAVSKLEIITRRKNDLTGIHIRVKGGSLEFCKEISCAPGTTIIVKNLFFNVPARKAFLKTKTTEMGHIIEMVSRQALIHSQISFKLTHNKKDLLDVPSSENPLDPFLSIYGLDLTKEMLPINFTADGVSITGYTSKPSQSRSARDYEMIYVNKRYVKSRLISEAIEEGYKTLLMKHRYPITLLNIKLEQAKIDVNIHPTKREIRFANKEKIFELVKEAIISTLKEHELWHQEKGIDVTSSVKLALEEGKDKSLLTTITEETINQSPLVEKKENQEKGSTILASRERGHNSTLEFVSQSSEAILPLDESNKKASASSELLSGKISETKNLRHQSQIIRFSDTFWLRPLGQAHELYILCETLNGIAVVDIHAAHERIRYEHLTNRYKEASMQVQKLLSPISIRLPPEQMSFLKEYLPTLQKLGVNAQFFGKDSLVIRGLPVSMDITKTEKDIRQFIDEVYNEIIHIEDITDRIDLTLKTMACHSAVRGGDALTLRKIRTILTSLAACKTPYTCPHGRPTIILISEKALEKEFGRIV